MFNRLYGEDRAIVSPIAGTTRDTLDAEVRACVLRYNALAICDDFIGCCFFISQEKMVVLNTSFV